MTSLVSLKTIESPPVSGGSWACLYVATSLTWLNFSKARNSSWSLYLYITLTTGTDACYVRSQCLLHLPLTHFKNVCACVCLPVLCYNVSEGKDHSILLTFIFPVLTLVHKNASQIYCWEKEGIAPTYVSRLPHDIFHIPLILPVELLSSPKQAVKSLFS